MPRTRANGEGTIYFNGTSWVAQVSTPDGRRSKAFTTQRKARSWLTQQRRDMDTGDYIEPSEMQLGIWWDKWVEVYKKREVSIATLATYSYAKKRLSAKFLKMPIGDIRTSHIQDELNRLDDLGLSCRTVEMTRTPLMMCFDGAIIDKMIRENPVKKSKLPDDDAKESIPLTIEEEQALVKHCTAPPRIRTNGIQDLHEVRKQPYKDSLLLILRTGIRRSECIELLWSDWQGNMLRVRGTKTDEADRTVPLPPDAIELLKRRQATTKTIWIIEQSNSKQLDGRNLLRYISAFNGHKVHDLRHTYCTRAAQAGVNPKVLQTITGHKKIETLLKIYTHVTDQDRAEAAAKISAYCKSTANLPENSKISRNIKIPTTLQPQGLSVGG